MQQSNKISQLEEKLEKLIASQKHYIDEIMQLKKEIKEFKSQYRADSSIKETQLSELVKEKETPKENKIVKTTPKLKKPKSKPQKQKSKRNLEEFIGENLAGKLGIIITIIGVGIGVKYAIDKDILGPITRISLAYLVGFILLGLAIKIKRKYLNYSAVLISGAFAVLYFVSYATYAYYQFIPQSLTFILMLIFTGTTVWAAISYDRQIIAHIGLVGAYTIPFLLSDGSGKIGILFTYMSIINIGILVLSLKKYWKPLFFSSFTISWLIFVPWMLKMYEYEKHFALAILFSTLFFATFYIVFLIYKFFKNENFDAGNILLVSSNAFVFFGVSYYILDSANVNQNYFGLLTVIHAAIHFGTATLLQFKKDSDKNLKHFLYGLSLVFITIAVPISFEGSWITLLWTGEAALFIWLGLNKKIIQYEALAYPMILLMIGSILNDWSSIYEASIHFKLFTNIHFLITLLSAVTLAFGLSQFKKNGTRIELKNKALKWLQNNIFLILILFLAYFGVQIEISHYFDQVYETTKISLETANEYYTSYAYNYNLHKFSDIWTMNYTLLYFTVISILSAQFSKNNTGIKLNLLGNTLTLFFFIGSALYMFHDLQYDYINKTNPDFAANSFYLLIRPISYIFVILLFISSHYLIKKQFLPIPKTLNNSYFLALNTVILIVLSAELLFISQIYSIENSNRYLLTVLWGIYAIILISFGFYKKLKYLRITGLVLIFIALVKLFVFDISDVSKLYKTIIFVSLGVLLLIISFLYTKYKDAIFGDDEKNENDNAQLTEKN